MGLLPMGYMMSRRAFTSSLAEPMAEFIAEKLAVGYRYVSEVDWLRVFDRYLVAVGHIGPELSKDVVQGWVNKRPHESGKTHSSRVCVLRQFAQFLLRHGQEAYVPDLRGGPIHHNNFRPWIFTRAQMKDMLIGVDGMGQDCRAPLRHLVMPGLFRILYGCGLRCGEAVRLSVHDVNLSDGVLLIREGKFCQDRLVPMAPALVDRLRIYSTMLRPRASGSAFFPAPHGGAYSVGRVYDIYRRLLRFAGIPHGGPGVGPRLHDIRATFAVHRVEAWYREGADLGAKLPILSAYMGHQSLVGTQKYLRLTMAIFPDLARRFEQTYGHLLPQLSEP